MGKIWSAYEAVIDNCVNKDFLVLMLVLAVAQMIGLGLVLGVGVLLLIASAFLGPVAVAVVVFLTVLALTAFSSLFMGLYFNAGVSQLERNKAEFDAALKNSLDHLFNSLKLGLLALLVAGIFFGLFFLVIGAAVLPALASVFTGGAAPSGQALLATVGGAFSGLLLFIFVAFAGFLALTPFTSVLFILPFAEGTGARASIRRAIELGKAHYWDNLKLVGLNMITSSGAFSLFYLAAVFLMVPLLAFGGLGGFAIALNFVYLLAIILGGVFQAALGALFLARLYLFDAHG